LSSRLRANAAASSPQRIGGSIPSFRRNAGRPHFTLWKVKGRLPSGPDAYALSEEPKKDGGTEGRTTSGRNGNRTNGIPPVSSSDHRWPWIAARSNRWICGPRRSESPVHDRSSPRSLCEAATTPSVERTNRIHAGFQTFHRPGTRNATIRTGSSALPRHHRFDVEFSRMTSHR